MPMYGSDSEESYKKRTVFCFHCSCNLGKDQVRVFRKSEVDIARLIKRALDVDVSVFFK